jgi:ABC-type uncharacterized transport system ATPase subunit
MHLRRHRWNRYRCKCGGEIVGIAGVSGNGQQELLAALSGEDRRAAAQMLQLKANVGRAARKHVVRWDKVSYRKNVRDVAQCRKCR